MTRRLAALIAGLILPLAGCRPAETEVPHLVVTGAHTLAPLVERIAARFEAAHPGVRVRAEASSSADAVAATRTGLADVGMITRPLLPGEAGLDLFPLAQDGVAFIVHKSNPVAGLNERQVAGLFSGLLLNW